MPWISIFPSVCTVIPLCSSDRHRLPTSFLQKPFTELHETKPKGGGVGKFVASQCVEILMPSDFRQDLRMTKFLVVGGMSLKESQTSKMASLLIYCSLKSLGRTKPNSFPSENMIALPIPPFFFFLSPLNIYKCIKAYRDCGPQSHHPHSTDEAFPPS